MNYYSNLTLPLIIQMIHDIQNKTSNELYPRKLKKSVIVVFHPILRLINVKLNLRSSLISNQDSNYSVFPSVKNGENYETNVIQKQIIYNKIFHSSLQT